MSYRPLELVIQHAQGLKHVSHFTKIKTYAEVFIRDHNNILHSSKRRTSVCSQGGSNPTWNFNVKFTINLAIAQENHLDLVVKLKAYRKIHGKPDKGIGEVRVLISELLNCFGDDDDAAEDEKRMSKDVVTSDGEENGALTFSYKFGRTDPNVKQRPKRGANGGGGKTKGGGGDGGQEEGGGGGGENRMNGSGHPGFGYYDHGYGYGNGFVNGYGHANGWEWEWICAWILRTLDSWVGTCNMHQICSLKKTQMLALTCEEGNKRLEEW